MEIDLSGLSEHLCLEIVTELGLYRHEEEEIDFRAVLTEFVTSHREAERAVSRLILKHLGISRSVFRPPLHRERMHATPFLLIIPNLSPIPWLSDQSWGVMTEDEKMQLMAERGQGFWTHGISYSHNYELAQPTFSNFGQSLDRVVLGHGPRRLLVIVGIHGNEPCGVEAVKLLLQKHALFTGRRGQFATTEELDSEDSWNTIVIDELMAHLTIEFLVGNPAAILQGKRFLKTNLNRALDVRLLCTGNDDECHYELQRARILVEAIRHADAILDIHSCSSDSDPFAIPSSSEISEELASCLPVGYVLNSLATSIVGGGTSMDCAVLHGIAPAIVVECGRHDHPNAVARATDTISSFLLSQLEHQSNDGGAVKQEQCLQKKEEKPIVMTCKDLEIVNEGFGFLESFREFQFIPYGQPVFRDDVRGEVTCPIEPGAYLVMPNYKPVIGEEALFWAKAL